MLLLPFLLENRNGKNEYKFFVGNAITDGMIKSAYMDIDAENWIKSIKKLSDDESIPKVKEIINL